MTVLALDFDGVIATQPPEPGFRMPRPDPEAHDAIRNLARSNTLVCFTARATTPPGRTAVEHWLTHYGLGGYFNMVTAIKFPWIDLFIDDRGYRFGSWSQTLADLPRILASQRPTRSRGAPQSVYSGSPFQ